ncbi:MAG: Ig-like domain-containing protein, partial [Pyrinomonadaceae bacterium]
MRKSSPAPDLGTLKVFVACLLSFAILITPIAAIAAPRTIGSPATKADKKRGSVAGEASKSSAENLFANAPVPEPAPAPPFAAIITATMTDNRPGVDPASAKPGDTINYTVTIQNTGDADATSVQFNDTIDTHTAYVANSGLLAMADAYNTIGDVQISVPDGSTDLLGNDLDLSAGNNNSMTATAQIISSANCTGGCSNNVTINANGSFTYDPPVGFTGTDSFNYISHNANNTRTAIAKVQITVTGRIWFINNNAGACPSGSCDGRLSHPFPTLAAFQGVNGDGAAGHPQNGDVIFVYESATAYVGQVTLRTNQKLIGQDATATLISLSGLTQPSGTDPLPTMNTGGNAVTITSASNAINLGTGAGNANLLRGFTVGATTGAKISGS